MFFFQPAFSGGAVGPYNMGEYLVDENENCLTTSDGVFLISSNIVSLLADDNGRTLINESAECLLAVFEE